MAKPTVVATATRDDHVYAFVSDGRVFRAQWMEGAIFGWVPMTSVPIAPPEPEAPPVPSGYREIAVKDADTHDLLRYMGTPATLWRVLHRSGPDFFTVEHFDGPKDNWFQTGTMARKLVVRAYRQL